MSIYTVKVSTINSALDLISKTHTKNKKLHTSPNSSKKKKKKKRLTHWILIYQIEYIL